MKLSAADPDLQTICGRIKDKEIDLQPDFQRDLVWSKQKKQNLIDTILRQWKFPPVYFVVPHRGFVLDVLDGQQRLNAIYDFVNNGFPVDGKVSPLDDEIERLDGKYFRDLPQDVMRSFLRYTIRVYELEDYKNDEPHELFFRLNQGSSLTPAEKRNTLYGPVREEVRSLVNMMIGEGYGVETIGFANNRYSYHDVISRLIFLLENPDYQRKVTDSDLVSFFREAPFVSERTTVVAREAIRRLSSVFGKKIKLNKATLLSWLSFSAYNEIDAEFIYFFDGVRVNAKDKMSVNDVMDYLLYIYNEKSSSSVNDAQPVKIRLFCIYAFAYAHGNYELRDRSDSISNVLKRLDSSRNFSEDFLVELLSDIKWGQI